MKQPLSLPPIHPKLAAIAVALAMIAAIITSIPLITQAEEMTYTYYIEDIQSYSANETYTKYVFKNVLSHQICAYETDGYYSICKLNDDGTKLIFYQLTNGIEYIHGKSNDSVKYQFDNRVTSSISKPTTTAEYSRIVDTNIPLFSNEAEALNFLLTGDNSGQLNAPEIVDLDNFTLTGFECDNTIHATWTGVNCPEPVDEAKVTVSVVPSYFIILEPGEDIQDFEEPEPTHMNGEYSFYKPYEDYFTNNPYKGRCQLILKFIPTSYDLESNTEYRGKPIVVTIDEKGRIESTHIPESALTPNHNSEFSLNNFTATSEFHNIGDSFVHCYWNGATIPNNVNYVYSDIKIQLYARTGETSEDITYKWIDYELQENISINTNRLNFNLTTLDEYCREKGYRFYDSTHGWKNEKIRITPYYKTTNEYVYGKSVEVTLTTLGGVDSILQSQGDAINNPNVAYDDLEKDYFTDNSIIDDIIGDIENNETDIGDLTQNFFTMLNSFFKACGQFPSLVASVFFFLPSHFSHMLTVALGVIIIMRIIGR